MRMSADVCREMADTAQDSISRGLLLELAKEFDRRRDTDRRQVARTAADRPSTEAGTRTQQRRAAR